MNFRIAAAYFGIIHLFATRSGNSRLLFGKGYPLPFAAYSRHTSRYVIVTEFC